MRTPQLLASIVFLFAAPALYGQISPDHLFRMGDGIGPTGSQQDVVISCDFPNAALGLQGWSFAVCVDSAVLTPVAAVSGAAVFTAKEGEEADFHVASVFPEGINGGCIVCFSACAFLPPGSSYEFAILTFELLGNPGSVADVEFCDDLGSPPVTNGIVDATGAGFDPLTESATMTILDVGALPFIRGDCNTDAFVSIADGITLLFYLFTGGTAPPCDTACDFEGDGILSLVDVLALLTFIFLDGPEPAAPFPGCGFSLDVCDSSACP